jgi:hypothetical protein
VRSTTDAAIHLTELATKTCSPPLPSSLRALPTGSATSRIHQSLCCKQRQSIAYLVSWIASFLAMTLAEGECSCHKERAAMTLGGEDILLMIVRLLCEQRYNKAVFSWILGSSGACPRMTGEGDGLGYEERSVEAKDNLLSWIASSLRSSQ